MTSAELHDERAIADFAELTMGDGSDNRLSATGLFGAPATCRALRSSAVASLLTAGAIGLVSCKGEVPPRPAQATASPAIDVCRTRALAFRPRPGLIYQFSAEERHSNDAPSTQRKLYQSRISFIEDSHSHGWIAGESAFAVPFHPWTMGDPTSATLKWRLDKFGVPQGLPEEQGFEKRDILLHLSLFDFWPVGIVLPSTCPSDVGQLTREDAGRPRSVRFTVLDSDSEKVRMHVEIRRGTWRLTGTVEVELADGLTGEAHLHEEGPGAPNLNDNQRVIRVLREERPARP